MKCVLIGCRCSGKTLVGREVAQRLGAAFKDSDRLVEARAGKSVAEIFAQDGEGAFRALERDVIAQLRDENEAVIAAGGGAVMEAANVEALKHNAKVIWLETSPEELTRRAQAEEENGVVRPPLTDLPPGEEIAKIARERRELYMAAADCIIATDGLTVEGVADRVVDYLELLGIVKPPEKSTGT